jgi:hypothetical protein
MASLVTSNEVVLENKVKNISANQVTRLAINVPLGVLKN